MQGFFRSVLADIAIKDMGLCYAHEHIVIEESYPTQGNSMFLLNDVDKISRELSETYRLGCRTMVDTMPANAGRNVVKMAEVSKKSGINIIIPTGLHSEMYYVPNHWRFHYSEDELTRLFIDDVVTGIDAGDYGGPIIKRTPYKAGMIKLATGNDPITKHQEKIFHAVVNTHKETGVPILTHTNAGKQALEQVEMFDKLGADLEHIVISHMDKCKDIDYNRAVLETGVYIDYDSAFRWKEGETNWTYQLLQNLLADFPDQIVMGMDAAKNIYWKTYDGKPGLDFLLTTFKNDLEKMGLSQHYSKIFFDNPAKLYEFK